MNNQDIIAGFEQIFGSEVEQKLNEFKDAVYINKFEQGRASDYYILNRAMNRLNMHEDDQRALLKQVGLEISREKRINRKEAYHSTPVRHRYI